MALTLVEASKLSNDILLEGIVEEIIKDSPILQSIPFIEIVGDGLRYNRELTLPSIDFFSPGDPWSESTPIFESVTANLTIMGGDADVDAFLKATRSNIQDLEAAVIQQKAKALRHKWENTFLYGDTAVNPKEFDGLRKIIDLTTAAATTRQVVLAGVTANGVALTLIKLDELIDKVKGGKPTALIMSKRSRRLIQNKTRAAGFNLETSKTEFGTFITRYNGIPIWESDWQLDTHRTTGTTTATQKEDSTTAGDESVIYAVRLGEGALSGLTAPGHIQIEPIGKLETKDATRTRIKFYTSIAVFSTLSVAALIGFDAS